MEIRISPKSILLVVFLALLAVGALFAAQVFAARSPNQKEDPDVEVARRAVIQIQAMRKGAASGRPTRPVRPPPLPNGPQAGGEGREAEGPTQKGRRRSGRGLNPVRLYRTRPTASNCGHGLTTPSLDQLRGGIQSAATAPA